MSAISPGFFLQEGSHPAKNMRQILSALVGQDVETFSGGVSATGPGHGVVRPGHLAVTEKSGTPDLSVDVARGHALITGDSSLAQGVYAFTNDAVVNLAIATADGTNPRRDLVVAQVRDNAEDSGGNNDMRLAVVTGTPGAVPVDPAVPAGCLVLARVAVAAGATSITNANITDLRTQATTMHNLPQLGSNANGNWARFPSGLQVCWFVGARPLAINTAYGSLFQGVQSFTFPQPFASEPHVSAGRSQWGTGRSWALVSSATTTSCIIGYVDTGSRAAQDTTVSYVAVGLWTP